jgi:glycerol-3-phosphate dehydrogenase
MYSRAKNVSQLKGKLFDILIIGGGATGAGIALDAASRGLKVALVDKSDFSAGTSSRSTKLIHGGVRYLEEAVLHFDKVQFNLVKDALKERYAILHNAKHLSKRLTLVTPLYKYYEAPYIFTGLLLYDLLSGKKSLGRSSLLNSHSVEQLCNVVNKNGLKAGVKYYDGQFFDARLNIAIIKTAVKFGAKVCNYLKVCELTKENGFVNGAIVEDQVSKENFHIRAKAVVNATGPFTDSIRKMDNQKAEDMITVSSGIHIVLDRKYTAKKCGLMIPKTEDGRVLFVLPWNNHTLVGTTDEEATVEDNPAVKDRDIQYLLKHVNKYFEMAVSEREIKSKWSGLRPLVKDPNKSDTAKLARDHVIEISESNLFTIAGGKWTTYRKMAEDMVDKLVSHFQFGTSTECYTDKIYIDGTSSNKCEAEDLIKEYNLDKEIISRFYHFYGENAKKILSKIKSGNNKLLDENYPYYEEEIKYLIKEEFAIKPSDILIRRLMIALVDIEEAKNLSDKIIAIMKKEFSWDEKRVREEEREIEERLNISL